MKALAWNIVLVAFAAFTVAAVSAVVTKSASTHLGAAAQTQWEGFLETRICPEVDTDFGDTPGTCTGASFRTDQRRVCVSWNTEDSVYRMIARVRRGGQFTPD